MDKELKALSISADIIKVNSFMSKKTEMEEIFAEGAEI